MKLLLGMAGEPGLGAVAQGTGRHGAAWQARRGGGRLGLTWLGRLGGGWRGRARPGEAGKEG